MSHHYPLLRSFTARLCRQEVGGGGTAVSWPPTSLLSSIQQISRGTNNQDMTPDKFLTYVRRDQRQYFLERLREYEAMLHMIGLLAGIAGTEDEQKAARDKLKNAIESYMATIEIPDEQLNPFAVPIGTPHAAQAQGGMAIAYLFNRYILGQSDEENIIVKAGEANDHANQALTQMLTDLLVSIWNSLRDWLSNFWETYESEGLIIAMNRARIDVAFFAAECAIDIAVGAVTAGFGAAVSRAIKGLRFVGMRSGLGSTRVVIKAIPDNHNRAPTYLMDTDVADDAIDPQFDRIVDEDRFGGGGAIDDTDTRTTPNADTPNTTVIRGSGRNEATIVVDPETGRPESVTASIKDDMGANPRGDNAAEIGKLGDPGDHGGHLIAHRFMGDVPDQGIVPQAGNLNTGAWKTMENEWADWVAYGRSNRKDIEISVEIDVDPPGAVRPDRFDVFYTVREVMPDGTKRVVQPERHASFRNQAGETFDRVYFRTDPDGTMQLR